jgi:hypothetical protein
VIEVRYEQLIGDPATQLNRIVQFTGLSLMPGEPAVASRAITAGRQGAGRGALTETELTAVDAEVGDLLSELGYDRPNSENASNDTT